MKKDWRKEKKQKLSSFERRNSNLEARISKQALMFKIQMFKTRQVVIANEVKADPTHACVP